MNRVGTETINIIMLTISNTSDGLESEVGGWLWWMFFNKDVG